MEEVNAIRKNGKLYSQRKWDPIKERYYRYALGDRIYE